MNEQYRYLPALGRLFMAAIILISGGMKVLAPSMAEGYIAAAALPARVLAYLAAVAIELGGGVLLMLGFQIRLAAAGIAFYCVATALSFHSKFADPNQMINFLRNFAQAGGLLKVVAFGAGALSLDSTIAASAHMNASAGGLRT
jgi:putative oxidoreductase